MNFSDALRELMAQLCEFIIHEQCLVEFSDLIKKDLSGHQKEFLKQLATQLKNLQQYKHQIYEIDDNEKLKGTKESLYSLRMKSKNYNIRLIVAFNNDDIPILLSVFYERSGKKKTDYSEKISEAERRLKEVNYE